MRILVIVHVFPPEHAPAGIMVRELAEDLVLAGHSVIVLTGFPHHPQGFLYKGWKAKFRQVGRELAGYRLIRCGHSILPGKYLAVKLLYYLTFALSTFVNGLLEGRCDIVLCLSTPIFGSWSSRILALVKRANFVYDIFDLHPEATRNAGLLNGRSFTYQFWRAQDTLLCWSSHAILTLSDGMKREICKRGISEAKVHVIPFWIDPDRIIPRDRLNPWRQKQGIADSVFTALFAGTIGHISGAGVLIAVAKRLVDRPEILLLCVGDGPLQPELQAAAKAEGLSNIQYLPFQKEEELSDMLATADVGLITMLPESGSTSVPSKVLGYLAAGRPVIASVDAGSETARIIIEGQCGEVVPPQDDEALAAALIHAADGRTETESAGQRARHYFLRHYGRQSCTARYRDILQEVATRP